jgi:lipopolysaccharide/colanic/teichoic acid biosynthesis glycosyltransferase
VSERPAPRREGVVPRDGSPPLPSALRSDRVAARRVKHALDRTVAAVAIVITAPLFLLVAVALLVLGIRRVLRVETRIGDRGPFRLASFDLRPDIPYWLRRVLAGSGVALLPQLFSLLRGDVSLVGPRPRYPGEPRPPVRPGMAGLAQAEQAVRLLDRDAVFALDAEYAAHWSLGLDVRILARGARRLLAPRRAHR